MLRILVRNIVSNWIGFFVQATVVFFLTPFIVHSLGDTRYGVWALVTSFTGYYGMLDLGFRSGITQYLTRHLATKDFQQLNRAGSTAFVALAFCGGIVALVSLGITWIAPSIFTIPADAITEARWCICVIGLTTGVQFPFFLYSSVFAATQRYDLANVVNIAVCLVTAAATVVALTHGYGLVALCVVNAVGLLLSSLARWRVACRILPQLRISLGGAAWESLRSIANFGLWSFLIQNATILKWCAGGLIIAVFMPVSALTPYSLALGLITYFSSFCQSMAGVFFPVATQLDAQGDMRRLRQMYLIGSKMLILLAMPAAMIGVVWAGDFFRLWVGERFVDGNEYPSVALLFWLLIVSAFIAAAQRIGTQVLLGRRKLKQLASIAVGEAAVSLVLSVVLVQGFGLVGVALGPLVSAILFQGLMHPIVVCRAVGVPTKEYLQLVWLRPCIAGVSVFVGLELLRHLLPTADTWPALFLSGTCAAVLSTVALMAIGLDRSEQRRFLAGPLARFRLLIMSE